MRKLTELKKLLTTFSILSITFVLTFASFTFSPAAAATTPGHSDWQGVMGNCCGAGNWDNSNQTQVGVSNVGQLQISWLYPVPAAPSGSASASTIITTPLIVAGIVYSITDYNDLIAQNAKTGTPIWSHLLCCSVGVISGHYHGLDYTPTMNAPNLNKPVVWVESANGTLWAIDALAGNTILRWNICAAIYNYPCTSSTTITPTSTQVPGNFGQYSVGSTGSKLLFDTQRAILVTGSAGSEGTNAGRGFFAGFNMTTNPPTRIWQSFILPPQDGSDPNWALNSVGNMTNAYLFNGANNSAINLKTISPTLEHQILYKDWGTFGFNGTHSYAGGNAAWAGAWALDAPSGTAYVATAQAGPDFNASTRPGPNVWTSSVIALNDKTGQFVWAFKTTSHDLWDMDCSFGVIYGNATINGVSTPTIFKGCKNGYEYALNAKTGAMEWDFAGSTVRDVYSMIPNPLNQTQMTRSQSTNGCAAPKGTSVGSEAAAEATGCYPNTHWGIESNPAYDPVSQSIFLVTNNVPLNYNMVPITGPGVAWGASGSASTGYVYLGGNNMTVWGISANTGLPKWHYFINNVALRGGYTYTNGLLFVPLNDGNLDVFDASNGNLVRQIFIGTQMITEPAIGTDSNGNFVLVQPAGGSGAVPQILTATSSLVFAMNLGPAPAGSTVTSSGAASTVTVSGPTVTQTGTSSSSGISSSTFYAVAAVAAIFIIATGVLALRRRKPAA